LLTAVALEQVLQKERVLLRRVAWVGLAALEAWPLVLWFGLLVLRRV